MSETAINKVNKTYCASAYLAFRFIKDENMNFFQGLTHKVFVPKPQSQAQQRLIESCKRKLMIFSPTPAKMPTATKLHFYSLAG